MHTIYHIPGRKVGCTHDFARRRKQYPEGTEFEVIGDFVHLTDKQAGDIEWLFADIYGYPRGRHYITCNSEAAKKARETLGLEGLSARSKKAAATIGHDGFVELGKKGHPKGVMSVVCAEKRSGFYTMPHEDRVANGRAQAEAGNCHLQTLTFAERSEINGRTAHQLVTCKYCGKVGEKCGMARWHNERCKFK